MSARLLFVDDEPRILDGIRRLLRSRYDVETAVGPRAGLDALDRETFAVVVSDMRMPEMSGSEFLALAAERQPDAVQMILSGQADLSSTVEAVNHGNLFRFLIKPIDRESLTVSVDAAIEQHRLCRVEKEMLELTLTGAVGALGEVLAMARPQSSRRSALMQGYVDRIAGATELRDDWQLNVATMLADIGSLAVPDDVLERAQAGAFLSYDESQMVMRHPAVAADLLARIPRLEGVAEIVRNQHPDPARPPSPELAEQTMILQLAAELTDAVLRGHVEEQAITLIEQGGAYPPALFARLRRDAAETRLAELAIDELRSGMTLLNPLVTRAGAVVAAAGTRLTPVLIARIQNFATGVGVTEPIVVEFVPERVAT